MSTISSDPQSSWTLDRGKDSNWNAIVIFRRGTMFRWTLKPKEVLNKQILSASVPEAALLREVIWKKKLLPFGHCPKVAFTPPLVLDTFGVTFV